MDARMGPRGRPKRDAGGTKARVLRAGHIEFAEHGYNGGRVERIARRSRSNLRMIYHHFGDKERLYIAVLEDTYRYARNSERELNLENLPPVEGIRRLVEFTFDYFCKHPDIVSLLMNENLLRGRYLKKSRNIVEMTPLVEVIDGLLARGKRDGAFHRHVDATQLYITIVSLCFTHLSNRYTLGTMFQKDFSEPEWLAKRREHVLEVVITYLTAPVELAAVAADTPTEARRRTVAANRR